MGSAHRLKITDERMPLSEAIRHMPDEAVDNLMDLFERLSGKARELQLKEDFKEAAMQGRLIAAAIDGFITAVEDKLCRDMEIIHHDPESFRSRAMAHGGC